ncbi:MAG: anthranilate phosphoribosyltransferase [Pseudomonadota bacterium]
MSAFAPYLKSALSGARLHPAAMRDAMDLLLEGAASDVEAAGFLSALKVRGETVDELVAAAEAMRARALAVDAPEDVVDTCGTGGDGADTINISTGAAILAAACGARVAKHGNRAVSSKSGSSDVLTALGVNIHAGPDRVEAAIREAGIGFLFAAAHHEAVARVAGVRKALGVRTIFNLLGPLTNPAGARRQLMGVYDAALLEPLAQALGALGGRRAWTVHGRDGLDEITTTGSTFVASLDDGRVTRFEISPRDLGLPIVAPDALKGGDPGANADALRAIFAGEKTGRAKAHRDVVALNAAAALVVADRCATLIDGLDRAFAALDDGAAARTLDTLVAVTNGGAQ